LEIIAAKFFILAVIRLEGSVTVPLGLPVYGCTLGVTDKAAARIASLRLPGLALFSSVVLL
jgi:hypothetical protein